MGVERFLPHSGAMVLLDEIESYAENRIKTNLLIKENNAFLNEKGEFELYQSIELMAQSVGVLRGLGNEKDRNKLGFLLSVRGLKIHKNAVKIGTKLSIEALESMRDESGFVLYACKVWENGTLLAAANISLLNPSDEMLEQLKGGKN